MPGGNAWEAVKALMVAEGFLERQIELLRKPGYVGAVAFSRSGDPATGDFGDAKVVRKFGHVSDDLSAL